MVLVNTNEIPNGDDTHENYADRSRYNLLVLLKTLIYHI